MLPQGIKFYLLVTAVLVVGCNGSIGGSGERSIHDGVAKSLCVVDTPIRRLTRFEYNRTVRDLLGDTSNPADVLPPEEEVAGFNNQAAALTSSDLLIEQYMKVAEDVGARAVLNMAALLSNCDPALDGNDTCALSFIRDFGGRAFRRPLLQTEVERLKSVFDWAVHDPDLGRFEDGIQVVIEATLQSASFLYRPELGGETPIEGDVVPFTSWEMATKLSYMLWNTMPDDALFAAAAADELQTKEQIAAQATRMLEDDKARDLIRNFHTQWLLLTHLDSVTKDTSVYPAFSGALRPLWTEEIQAFVEHVILEGDGSLQTLLTADFSFMNEELGANPSCAGCHTLMNPIGFIFEHYDGVGQWRDQQNGKDIDATGEVVQTDDIDGEYDGALELASALAGSTQVQECVSSQWFRFAYNRTVTQEDSCSVEQLNDVFRSSNFNVMALACDLTRVASLQWSRSVSGVRFSWLPQLLDEGHHGLSHYDDSDASAKADLLEINKWYSGQFAYLLGLMDGIQEGDNTLLDNTVVVWVNELGQGNSHTRWASR